MSRVRLFLAMLMLALTVSALNWSVSYGQGPGKPIEAPRDAAKEIAAKHNLDVARWNLNKRKAYEGARDRLQEIIDTHPDFSKMDEVVFLMAEVYMKLGKKSEATDYYNKLLKDYESSELAKKARARLDELKTEPEKK